MKPRKHLRLLILVSTAWALFWLAGLPDYYQQYSVTFMILFDSAILPPIWIIVYRSSKFSRPGNAFNISFWWAFYISVPLFVYDLIYCGYYLGHGLKFLASYWYLTVYYILPWVLFPPTGWLAERLRSNKKIQRSTRNQVLATYRENSNSAITNKMGISEKHINQVSDNLLSFLVEELGNTKVDYEIPLSQLEGGYDTSVFQFKLKNVQPLLSRPLVLRVFRKSHSPKQAIMESVIQLHLARGKRSAPPKQWTFLLLAVR